MFNICKLRTVASVKQRNNSENVHARMHARLSKLINSFDSAKSNKSTKGSAMASLHCKQSCFEEAICHPYISSLVWKTTKHFMSMIFTHVVVATSIAVKSFLLTTESQT